MKSLYNKSAVVKNGLNFIAEKQLKNGGFESFCSQHAYNFQGKRPYHTTFFTSLIAGALSNSHSQESIDIRDKASNFLLMQKSKDYSFNYWDRADSNYTKRPYPDDLDDTFCALSVLYDQDPSLIKGNVLACIAHILFSTEIVPGGPYRTWLVLSDPDTLWSDVDPVVNSNVARFLSRQSVILPNLIRYIENIIKNNQFISPYYPDEIAFAYFLSDWYQGKYTNDINQLLLKKQANNFWGSPLNAALNTTTLLRNKYDYQKLTPAINYLLKSQHQNGSWPAAAFSIDLRNEGKTIYAGSSSLTTAFCVEAIEIYDSLANQQKVTAIPQLSEDDEYYHTVITNVRNDINSIKQDELKDGVIQIFERILLKDKDRQILLLPRLILQKESPQIDNQLLQSLSAISLWGWMAYTTYDDFLDQDGSRELLPSANYCLRKLINISANTLTKNISFQNDISEIMNRLDAANLWELQNCRGKVEAGKLTFDTLPNYRDHWQLADRSLGHSIAAIGILYAAGYSENSQSMRSLKKFFKHYLIARQLNDDAHDWEDDLSDGHINAVTAYMLLKRSVSPSSKSIDLQNEINDLRTILWDIVIVDVCEIIETHIYEARRALKSKNCDLNKELLNNLLLPVEAAVRKSLAGRKEALDFIRAL